MTTEHVEMLNYVANHPAVLPHIAGNASGIDLSPFFTVPENVMFGDHRGLILFLWQGEHIYDMHWLLTDEIRGKDALGMARNAIGTMFTKFDCCAITGATPRENLAARRMNRALGGQPVGESIDSLGRPCINYRLERRTWATSLAGLSAVSVH